MFFVSPPPTCRILKASFLFFSRSSICMKTSISPSYHLWTTRSAAWRNSMASLNISSPPISWDNNRKSRLPSTSQIIYLPDFWKDGTIWPSAKLLLLLPIYVLSPACLSSLPFLLFPWLLEWIVFGWRSAKLAVVVSPADFNP